jgi:hypothetical protein
MIYCSAVCHSERVQNSKLIDLCRRGRTVKCVGLWTHTSVVFCGARHLINYHISVKMFNLHFSDIFHTVWHVRVSRCERKRSTCNRVDFDWFCNNFESIVWRKWAWIRDWVRFSHECSRNGFLKFEFFFRKSFDRWDGRLSTSIKSRKYQF